MKYILTITIAFFFVSQISYSQEFKKKTKRGWWYKEQFVINKQTNIKQGVYRMITIGFEKKDTIIFGNYCNDRKCGNWVYKYGKDSLVYDYNDSIIKYIPKEIMSCDSAYVKAGDKFILKKVNSPAILIGYPYFICGTIKHDGQFKLLERGDKAVVSFVIDTTGNVKDIKIEKSINDLADRKLIDDIKESQSQLKWLPAKREGQPVESKISIEVTHVGNTDNLPKVKPKPYYQYVFFTYNGVFID